MRDIEGFQLQGRGHHSNFSSPYYTACQIIFIEDFIRSMVRLMMKRQMITIGNLLQPILVKERLTQCTIYTHIILKFIKGNSPIYSALHKTRRYRLDAFAGTGMTGVACSLASVDSPILQAELCNAKSWWGRRCSILNDLSNSNTYCRVYNLNRQVDVEDEEQEFLMS